MRGVDGLAALPHVPFSTDTRALGSAETEFPHCGAQWSADQRQPRATLRPKACQIARKAPQSQGSKCCDHTQCFRLVRRVLIASLRTLLHHGPFTLKHQRCQLHRTPLSSCHAHHAPEPWPCAPTPEQRLGTPLSSLTASVCGND